MLNQLSIKNFAIIDSLELDLDSGLTVFTGETGAGKSIMFDALELATGARADKSMVRHGAERAEVVAVFDISAHSTLANLLTEQDFQSDGELLLRRVVNADGRSRAYLNGTPVPVATLAEIGRHVVEIHGQHQHQTLTAKGRQLALLDQYAANHSLLQRLHRAFDRWRAAMTQLEHLRAEAALSPAEIELLTFQRDELLDLADDAARLEQLHQDQSRLANAEHLLSSTQRALELTDGDSEHHASALLAQAQRQIEDSAAADPTLDDSLELIRAALIQTQEAHQALRRYQDSIELDPGQLRQVEDRLSAVHEAARKHRVQAEDLPQRLHELESRLARADDSEQQEKDLLGKIDQQRSDYDQLARQTSIARTKAASKLSDQVTDAMQALGMAGGTFEIVVDHAIDRPARPNGLDDVSFLVSANPGQPPQPLGKVASGGELSRISLALKVALTEIDGPGSLIFDEVDAGVGGAVAEIVGQKLRAVATDRQVFCITHLPQVAACGHHHFQVNKQLDAGQTTTTVLSLGVEQRTKEVARMLGGVEITEKTTEHAAEMIRSANR